LFSLFTRLLQKRKKVYCFFLFFIYIHVYKSRISLRMYNARHPGKNSSVTWRLKAMNREKNNACEFKTIQDGGLIKKKREVNMNVGAEAVHECKKMGRAERNKLHSSSEMSDFLLVHLLLFLNEEIRPLCCVL